MDDSARGGDPEPAGVKAEPDSADAGPRHTSAIKTAVAKVPHKGEEPDELGQALKAPPAVGSEPPTNERPLEQPYGPVQPAMQGSSYRQPGTDAPVEITEKVTSDSDEQFQQTAENNEGGGIALEQTSVQAGPVGDALQEAIPAGLQANEGTVNTPAAVMSAEALPAALVARQSDAEPEGTHFEDAETASADALSRVPGDPLPAAVGASLDSSSTGLPVNEPERPLSVPTDLEPLVHATAAAEPDVREHGAPPLEQLEARAETEPSLPVAAEEAAEQSSLPGIAEPLAGPGDESAHAPWHGLEAGLPPAGVEKGPSLEQQDHQLTIDFSASAKEQPEEGGAPAEVREPISKSASVRETVLEADTASAVGLGPAHPERNSDEGEHQRGADHATPSPGDIAPDLDADPSVSPRPFEEPPIPVDTLELTEPAEARANQLHEDEIWSRPAAREDEWWPQNAQPQPPSVEGDLRPDSSSRANPGARSLDDNRAPTAVPEAQARVPLQTDAIRKLSFAWPTVLLPTKDRVASRPLLRRLGHIAALVALAFAMTVFLLIILYRWIDPPASTLMVGQRLLGGTIEQRWVPIQRISPHLIRAVVLSEDGAFCRHGGVDWTALGEAIESARGGSTITMQVVKNLFLWPARSYVRKALEIMLAYAVEVVWPKKRILEIYLNIAEWGPGVFGAEAAARNHFGKRAAQLTAHEAALLAVSLPNPIERQAGHPGWQTRRLANNLLIRMRSVRGPARCVRGG